MLDRLHKKLTDVFIQPFLKRYLKKERWFVYQPLKLKIYPGVFHPAYFFSTRFFTEFIQSIDMKNKSVCEVGAGSGLLSFIALLQGAKVCSFDISVVAVKGLRENVKTNFSNADHFHIYQSDLFDAIPLQKFDIVLINPPYFFTDPTNDESFAWYCGINGQYFEKLFKQLENYSYASSSIYMVLADNCDIERIRSIAKKNNYLLNLVAQKKIKWEKNFIFSINKH